MRSPSFIHILKNTLPKDVCKSFIESFEKRTDLHKPGIFGAGGKHEENHNIKQSTDITFYPTFLEDEDFGSLFADYLIPALTNGMDEYSRYFYVGMDNISPIELTLYFNMQKYPPGGGYKVFHCERAGNQFFPRTHAWMLYLNDINVGGETEFFYQQHFEKAEEGKLVIWPSDFTHIHRGIVAPYETKYILTGWFQYTEKIMCKEIDMDTNEFKGDVFELSLDGMHDKHHVLIPQK